MPDIFSLCAKRSIFEDGVGTEYGSLFFDKSAHIVQERNPNPNSMAPKIICCYASTAGPSRPVMAIINPITIIIPPMIGIHL